MLFRSGMSNSRKKYSDKELLEQIKSHYKINPSMTRVSFQEDKMVCSSSIIYMRFGNWKKALLKAGCKNNRRMINKNLPYSKVGKYIKYKRSDIETFLNNNIVGVA